MGINLEILMFLHSKMNAVKMIKKKCLDVSDFNITDSYIFLLLELPGKWMS